MTQEDTIYMAREAGFNHPSSEKDTDYYKIERFAALVRADERNKLVTWMMAQGYTYDTDRDKVAEWVGYTTCQGDATEDLLAELGWQIEQRIKGLMSDMSCQVSDRVKAEREACAALAEQTVCDTHLPTGVKIYGTRAAKVIRARGQA